MRAIFGLVGILLTIGVIVWFWGRGGGLGYTQEVLKQDRQMRDQMSQISGQDSATGERASDSADLEPISQSGRLAGLTVTSIKPDGAYAHYFGLQKDDTIIGFSSQGVDHKISEYSSEGEAKDFLLDAYQKHGTVVVIRNEQQMTLPAAAPKTAGAPQQSKDSVQSQLDAIQGVPR